LRFTAPPKEALYAGAILLLLSPLVWLGSFVFFWPWWYLFSLPRRERLILANGLMVTTGALLGAAIAFPGLGIGYDRWQEPRKERQAQIDYERTKSELTQGAGLSAYKGHLTPGTQWALLEALLKTDSAAQIHEIVMSYSEDRQLMARIAQTTLASQ